MVDRGEAGDRRGEPATGRQTERDHSKARYHFGQLYAWRQQLTRRIGGELARPGDQAQPAPSFARVDVVSRQPQENATPTAETPLARPSVQVPLSTVSRMRGLIEIVLPGGASVRVDAQVDDRALRCVLGALRER